MLTHSQEKWLLGVANVYVQNQKLKKALPLLLLLIQTNPKSEKPLKLIAYAYYQQGRTKQALQCCQQYERLAETQDCRMILLKSLCEQKLQQFEQAQQTYDRYIRLRGIS